MPPTKLATRAEIRADAAGLATAGAASGAGEADEPHINNTSSLQDFMADLGVSSTEHYAGTETMPPPLTDVLAGYDQTD
jgi:hypothetical protein